jgi:LacI family transcriptional regulator
MEGLKPVADLTLEDIAKKAGVSRSTVSRVVNRQPDVSESVRLRVLAVIEETGFHPNAAARTLASQRSFMIGLVLPKGVGAFFSDPYFPLLTQGIAQGCNQNDFTLGLFILDSIEDEDRTFPRISRKGLLDGILVQAGSNGDTLIERLVKADIPSVILGRPMNPQGVNYIDVENRKAAKQAVDHILSLGRTRIAILLGPELSTVSMDRKSGYLDAILASGISLDESLMIHTEFSETGGYLSMKNLFMHHPDAVFACSDALAYGAIRAIREQGLRVPQDVVVVGFDDLPVSPHTTQEIHLTTIHQPVLEFGIKAVELLIDRIENGCMPARQVIVGTQLVIRDTCGSMTKEI